MPTALLIIDVQAALFDISPRPDEAEVVIARINALSARARAAGAPVLFIQHESPQGRLAHQSDGWQLAQGLHRAAGDGQLRKTTPDSFLRTGLQDWLAAHGVRDLVLCGYASEYCVDSTTRRAAALGYPVQLVADAHTTHDKPHASAAQIRLHHNVTLPDLTSFGPPIVARPSAQIVFSQALATTG